MKTVCPPQSLRNVGPLVPPFKQAEPACGGLGD